MSKKIFYFLCCLSVLAANYCQADALAAQKQTCQNQDGSLFQCPAFSNKKTTIK